MSNKFKKDLIIFLDENNEKKDMFVNIIDYKDSFIIFETQNNNKIILPYNRILKIKIKGEDSE